MDPTYQLLSIRVQREVNRIPRADLTLIDGDPADQKFAISDTDFFAPGSNIEIRLGYEGEQDQTVFKGLVLTHSIEAGRQGSFLTVGLKDAAVKLTGARRIAVYSKMKDSEVISKLISDANLAAGDITSTTPTQEQLVQYSCTDWDFILARANANGLSVYIDDDKISTTDLSVSGSPAMKFDWGVSEIFDFEFAADGGHQFADVTSTGWDGKQLAVSSPAKAKNVSVSQGNLAPATIASKIGFDTDALVSLVPMDPSELSAWADGTMVRIRASALRGRLTVRGVNDLSLLDVIELAGFSERFNGKTLVTGIGHRLGEGEWMTDIQFGISPDTGTSKPNIIDDPAAGLLPGVLGLQIGLVTSYNDDPEGEYRVEVSLPAVPQDGTVWARLCAPDAGKKRGYFFRPEVGDEVVVGFLNNDPRYPIILGALYSSTNTPPDDFSNLSDKNVNKGLVSRAGTMISFVDGDSPSLFIQTPGKNKILLDDEGKAIKLTDQNGNSLTMDENGIAIKSSKGFKIDAGSGNVEISGTQVDVK
jgi:Rhs element Vgr protein